MPHRLRSRVRRINHSLHHMSSRRYGLILIAFTWFLVGASRLRVSDIIDSAWHLQIPASVQTTMWLTASFTALAAAVETGQVYPNRDTVALAVASIPPVLWLSSHLWSWLVSVIPGPPPGSSTAWISAGFYAGMVGLVWLVAMIPDTTLPESTGDVENGSSHRDRE